MSLALQEKSQASSEPTQFWNAVVQWLEKNGGAAVQSAVVGAVFGYAANFVMSWSLFNGRFDGAEGGVASVLKSTLFFGIVSTVVFGLIGYRRAVGKERFWQAIRDTPKTITMLFKQDGAAARIHLLWGAGLSFLAMQYVSPWLGAAVAFGFLTAVPSVFGRVIAALLSRLWSSLASAVAPTKGQRVDSSVGMLVGMVGSAAALVLGGVITDPATKLVAAGGCIMLAFVMRNSGRGTAAPLLLVALAALLCHMLDLLHPLMALAYHCVRGEPGCHEPQEFGGLLVDGGDGAPGLSLLGIALNSTGGGLGGGVGAPLGFGIGWVAGQFPWGSYPSGGGYPFGGGYSSGYPFDGQPSTNVVPPPAPPAIQPPVTVAPPPPPPPPPPPVADTADDLPQGPPPAPDFSSSATVTGYDTADDLPQGPPPPPSFDDGPVPAPEPLQFGPLGPPDPPRFDEPASSDDLPELPDLPITRDAVTAGEPPPYSDDPDSPDESEWTPSAEPQDAPPPYGHDGGSDLPGVDGGAVAAKRPTLDDIIKMIEDESDPAEVERLKGIAQRAADLAAQGKGSLAGIRKALEGELERQKERGLVRSAASAFVDHERQRAETLWGTFTGTLSAVRDFVAGDDKDRAEFEALKKRVVEEGRARGEPVDDPYWLRANIIKEAKRASNEKIVEGVKRIPEAVKSLSEANEAELAKLRAKVIEAGRAKGEDVDNPYWLRAKMIEEMKRQGVEKLQDPAHIKEITGLGDMEKAANMPLESTTDLERLKVALPGAAKFVGLVEGVRGVGSIAAGELAAAGTGKAVLEAELAAAREAAKGLAKQGGLVAEGAASLDPPALAGKAPPPGAPGARLTPLDEEVYDGFSKKMRPPHPWEVAERRAAILSQEARDATRAAKPLAEVSEQADAAANEARARATEAARLARDNPGDGPAQVRARQLAEDADRFEASAKDAARKWQPLENERMRATDTAVKAQADAEAQNAFTFRKQNAAEQALQQSESELDEARQKAARAARQALDSEQQAGIAAFDATTKRQEIEALKAKAAKLPETDVERQNLLDRAKIEESKLSTDERRAADARTAADRAAAGGDAAREAYLTEDPRAAHRLRVDRPFADAEDAKERFKEARAKFNADPDPSEASREAVLRAQEEMRDKQDAWEKVRKGQNPAANAAERTDASHRAHEAAERARIDDAIAKAQNLPPAAKPTEMKIVKTRIGLEAEHRQFGVDTPIDVKRMTTPETFDVKTRQPNEPVQVAVDETRMRAAGKDVTNLESGTVEIPADPFKTHANPNRPDPIGSVGPQVEGYNSRAGSVSSGNVGVMTHERTHAASQQFADAFRDKRNLMEGFNEYFSRDTGAKRGLDQVANPRDYLKAYPKETSAAGSIIEAVGEATVHDAHFGGPAQIKALHESLGAKLGVINQGALESAGQSAMAKMNELVASGQTAKLKQVTDLIKAGQGDAARNLLFQ